MAKGVCDHHELRTLSYNVSLGKGAVWTNTHMKIGHGRSLSR